MLQPCNKVFKVTQKIVPEIYLLHFCLGRSYFDVHFFTTVPRCVAARVAWATLTERMKYVWHVLLALTFTGWAKKKYHVSNVYSIKTVKDTTNLIVTQERIY